MDITLFVLETIKTTVLVGAAGLALYLAVKLGVKHGITEAYYEKEKRSVVVNNTSRSDEDANAI